MVIIICHGLFTQVGLGEAEREAVLRTVAAVLHLGNIEFVPAADEGAAPGSAAATAALAAVADLLEARPAGAPMDLRANAEYRAMSLTHEQRALPGRGLRTG